MSHPAPRGRAGAARYEQLTLFALREESLISPRRNTSAEVAGSGEATRRSAARRTRGGRA